MEEFLLAVLGGGSVDTMGLFLHGVVKASFSMGSLRSISGESQKIRNLSLATKIGVGSERWPAMEVE